MLQEQQPVRRWRPPRGRPRAASGGPTHRGRRRVPARSRRSGRGLPPAVRPWADDSRGGPGSGLAANSLSGPRDGPARDGSRARCSAHGSRGRAALPHPVLAGDDRRGDDPEPDRVVGARHGHGRRRPGLGPPRRVPGGAGARRRRADRDPGRGRPPDGPLHLVRADRGRRRRDPGLRTPGRGDPPPWGDGVRAAVPRRPRDHGHGGRHARGGLGAVRGPDRAVPRHAPGDARGADRGDPRRVRGVRGAAGGRRAGRGRGRRVARLPAVAVPQPAHEPPGRRLGRRRGPAAAVPARGPRRVPGGDASRLHGRGADLDRRDHAGGPHGGRGHRGARGAGRRRGDGLRQRGRRDLGDAGRAPTTSSRRRRSRTATRRRSRRG